jgi:hypothetical protein
VPYTGQETQIVMDKPHIVWTSARSRATRPSTARGRPRRVSMNTGCVKVSVVALLLRNDVAFLEARYAAALLWRVQRADQLARACDPFRAAAGRNT